MSRISSCFKDLKNRSRTALIPFITAGDPQPKATTVLMHSLVEGGADIIELGIPFSDPMADGPVIQEASERALSKGTNLWDVLAIVKDFRRTDQKTPVVLMGYLNPVEALGYEKFANAAAQAGVDGILLVDLPPEEAAGLSELLKQEQIDLIFLIAPNTSVERVKLINSVARGYLYCVSVKGVTGSTAIDLTTLKSRIQDIREHVSLPLGVGFGIRDAATAAAIATVSDAVIVGSALVEKIPGHEQMVDKIAIDFKQLLGSMRQALDDAIGV